VYATIGAPGPLWTDVGTFAVLAAQLLVLVVAAGFAGYQVWEARRLREAQVRPFVVIDFEVWRGFVELKIKNFGATLARNVKFTFEPTVQTTFDADPDKGSLAEIPLFRDGIASLPPGKEITLAFDFGGERTQQGLPDSYVVHLTYRGEPLGREYKDEQVIDMSIYRSRGPIHRNGLHEIHAVLKEMLNTQKGSA
jgi:hypothetical protein